jgi:hypothetical protein
LCVTEAMREVRRITASPARSGLPGIHSSWLPAHMRRGSGTGGRKPPRRGWPSGPICDCGACGRKYSQCHSGGTGEPASTGLHWRVVATEHRLSLLLALEALQGAATAPVRPPGRVGKRPEYSSNDSA